MRALRATSGVVAAGVVVLAIAVVGAALLAAIRSVPGPGTPMLVAHGGAALVVLAAQWSADRPGRNGLSTSVVFGVAALLGWSEWLR